MQIEAGCVVLLDFTLADGEGRVLDRSPAGEPLAYIHGGEGILPALAEALSGRGAGDAFDVTLPPEQAYGEHRFEAVSLVPRAQIPEGMVLEVGMRLEDSSGNMPPCMVTEVTPEHVMLDANHPLAGVTLRFTGSVAEVRRASQEELALISGDDPG